MFSSSSIFIYQQRGMKNNTFVSISYEYHATKCHAAMSIGPNKVGGHCCVSWGSMPII